MPLTLPAGLYNNNHNQNPTHDDDHDDTSPPTPFPTVARGMAAYILDEEKKEAGVRATRRRDKQLFAPVLRLIAGKLEVYSSPIRPSTEKTPDADDVDVDDEELEEEEENDN